ncbi:MAG: type I restriction endonuclease subunit R [Deltaproteobacteria bacterium]|nr:type I restriction endonuclease subunit R [Deltaproteobacteria bacterium]
MKASVEKDFESYIQNALLSKGWEKGEVIEWDKTNALFPNYIISFIKDTQHKLWNKTEKIHGAELSQKLINTLIKERNSKGTLDILRKGFKFYGEKFYLAYYKPANTLNHRTESLFKKNRLQITRQVPCHPVKKDTVDILLSLNGIPFATIELKNPGSGQTWQDAINQYKETRDPSAPLFRFKQGALVYFACDTNLIYMATKLEKEKTIFLPFNRGSDPGQIKCGAGNPKALSGYKIEYFWEDILAKENITDILGNFMFCEQSETTNKNGKKSITEKIIFPRFHQLRSVKKLINAAKKEGAGHNYLIGHSAGSGKTNSISWLAHRLSSLHTNDNAKIFDSVVLVTDRKILDKQIRDAIYQIDHAQGVVKAIDKNANQLAEALISGIKIIITTVQKFSYVFSEFLKISGAKDPDNPDAQASHKAEERRKKIAAKKYAVIIDEAHSGQSGESARALKATLGAGTIFGEDEKDIDLGDALNRVTESRGRQKNISFFAFTATPKGKTIQLFGKKGASGNYEAFDSYSMRQAIEENFILDVLSRYTTYKTYYKIIKKTADDPNLYQKEAIKKIRRYVSLHPKSIGQKTEIIIEHFKNKVKGKLNGKAKGMVITESRLHAVKYKLSFEKYIKEKGYADINPLVAFSETVKDPETGMEYTEPEMNKDLITGRNISESALPKKFNSFYYQILIVADKYQTGFNQPLLCAMYADKKLDGARAVQALSRLNRVYKGKEAPFVLDFRNSVNDMAKAFKPYYDATILKNETNPAQIDALKRELNAMQIYYWSEVEKLFKIICMPEYQRNFSYHLKIEETMRPAVDRYYELEKEDKKIFYNKIKAYKNLYAFVSQIINYSDQEAERLYIFAKHLIPRLKKGDGLVDLYPENNIKLAYYKLKKQEQSKVCVNTGKPYGVKSPTATGTKTEQDSKKSLSEIINIINERYGDKNAKTIKEVFKQIPEKAAADIQIIKIAKANNQNKFSIDIKENIEASLLSYNDKYKGIAQILEDRDLWNYIYPFLSANIYNKARNRSL